MFGSCKQSFPCSEISDDTFQHVENGLLTNRSVNNSSIGHSVWTGRNHTANTIKASELFVLCSNAVEHSKRAYTRDRVECKAAALELYNRILVWGSILTTSKSNILERHVQTKKAPREGKV